MLMRMLEVEFDWVPQTGAQLWFACVQLTEVLLQCVELMEIVMMGALPRLKLWFECVQQIEI